MVTFANPPILVDQLLDKLGNDDDFRACMIADPMGVLHDMGLEGDAADIPALRTLPSKEVIRANRALIKAKLTTTDDLLYFILAGKA